MPEKNGRREWNKKVNINTLLNKALNENEKFASPLPALSGRLSGGGDKATGYNRNHRELSVKATK